MEDQRISARKNGLGISKSAFNRITKRDWKWHFPYKMHVRKERNNYKWSSLPKENQDSLKSVMAGMWRRMQVDLESNREHAVGNGN